jgi:outer membrane protein OmpA-like peptidoglycan-associated protein
MKSHLHFLIAMVIFFPGPAGAQTEVAVRKKDFKKENTGFKEAWKHVEAGNDYYDKGGVWFSRAYEEYLKAIEYNKVDPALNFKAGVAALFSDHKQEAIRFFRVVMESRPDIVPESYFYTARALQYDGNFPEAIEKYNRFLGSSAKIKPEIRDMAKKYIEECNSALLITGDTARVTITNMGSGINSNADEYSELVTADGKTMYFASRREVSNSSTYHDDTKFDENILFSTVINGEWGMAIAAGKGLSTGYCEAPLHINGTGEELYIYAGYENGGDIMVARNRKGKWQAPVPVSFKINSRGLETSMTFSPDGNETWFVSGKRDNGSGGKDIYFIRRIDERKWSKPSNAGTAINTPYDEESVRFSALGDTLWFSSKGHNSIGGFDIFYSVRDSSGAWGKARNIGYPVNTQWDELFYFPDPAADSSFYFASNRPGTMGGLDIFHGKLLPAEKIVLPPPPPPPPPPAPDTVVVRDTVVVVKEVVQPEQPAPIILYLIGKVSDSETGDPVLAKIDVIDLETDAVVVTTASSDADGSFRARLPGRKSFMVDFRANGYLSDMKRVNIAESYEGETYNLSATLIKVKVGKKVVLNNILFETGKSILTSGSYAELDRLLDILQDNPAMRIEISGHTDKTGSEPVNFKLSGDRAKAVVEYLVRKGIDPTRLESRGFGSLQPIADNTTAQGRSKNRRVEFKILEF